MTELLQAWEKPVPFRNRYYFSTLIFPVSSPSNDIKAPAIEPSIAVTEMSPSGHTPEQRQEYSDSQPKVTIFHTHTHPQTDTLIYRHKDKLWQWLLYTVLSLQKGNQRRKKPTKEVTKPTLPAIAVASEEVHTPKQRQEYSDSQPKVTIFHSARRCTKCQS